MMKKLIGLLALAAMSTVAFANVDLRTNIRDVYRRGSCEEAGAITMSVNGNDFKNATTTNPVFIRVRLDHQAVLCQTLVDDCDDPIYLAMRLEQFTAGTDSINAPAETVSIVRWQQGEPDIWLRVQSSSDTWVQRGPSATHPTDNRSVAWTFGITARSSWTSNVDFFADGVANLPSNTLDPSSPEQFDAASTLICTDLRNSDLTTTGVESLLNYDIISFTDTDHSPTSGNSVCAASSYSVIDVGRQEDINFSDDRVIARGIDIDCDWSIIGKLDYDCAVLCFETSRIDQSNFSVFGLTWIYNCLDIRVDCDYGWHNGSYVHLEQAAGDVGEDWGFLDPDDYSAAPFYAPNFAEGGDGYTGTTTYWPTSTYYGDGVYVNSWVDLVWNGSGSLGTRDLTICVSIGTHYQRSANDVNVAVNPVVTNRDTMFDTVPFDEAWQFAYCPPSEITLSQLDWAFGCFYDPTANPVTIFFPYVPKIINDDGSETGFWSGFAISNHGDHDYADGETWVSSYLADGTHFSANLEAIGTRQMQVYLLQNGDSGIGLYRVDCGLNTYTAMTPDDGTSTFGTKRSTMFVWGQHTAADCTEASTTGGDLDGYMLIGQGALINGGYLARNMTDHSNGDQDTDLPVSYGKRELRTKQNSPVQIISVEKRDEKVSIYR